MITIDNKKMKFIDSYLLGESTVNKILKSKNLPRGVYLENVARDFKDNVVVEKIFKSSEILSKDIFTSVGERLKKQIKLENSSIYIPLKEFVDVINFSILTEIHNLKESTQNDNKIKTLSNVMVSFDEKKSFEVSEETFSIGDIITTLENVSSHYTKNTEIKNDYFIITFD